MEGFNCPLCPPYGALLSFDITPFPILFCHLRWGLEVIPSVELSYRDFLNEPGIIMQCIIHVFLSTPLTCIQLLGGLSLHLNHLIGSHMTNYDWPFGTLPFGLFGSNLDTRDLETYPRTYSGHF